MRDGESLVVRGSSLFRDGSRLAAGRTLTELELEAELAEQRGRVTEALESFAENTLRYLRDEAKLLSEGVRLPQVQTRFRDRHALVVARGPGMKRDLRIVKPYIRDFRPVLVGVDGGADALIQAGYKPHVIVGDMDSVSDRALQSGAELIVHAYPDGRAPGRERIDRLGLPSAVLPSPGISEDVAILLAHEKGAELIVAVGTHFNLLEFLERNREGMSSTFFTRLKVGDKLIDARGVSSLFRGRAGLGPMFLVRRRRARRARRRRGRLLRSPALHRASRAAGAVDPRAVRKEASLVLPVRREDAWALVSEPFHLPDWWPGYTGVEPDRRGLEENARWTVVRALRPGLMRKPHGTGLIVIHRVSPASELAWHDLKQKLDMGIRLEGQERAHHGHRLGVGPVLAHVRRGSALATDEGRRPAARPLRHCFRPLRCSTFAITWPRLRPYSSRSRSGILLGVAISGKLSAADNRFAHDRIDQLSDQLQQASSSERHHRAAKPLGRAAARGQLPGADGGTDSTEEHRRPLPRACGRDGPLRGLAHALDAGAGSPVRLIAVDTPWTRGSSIPR